jgi:hypothetical protein
VNVCAVFANLEALLPELIIADIADNAVRMGVDIARDFVTQDRKQEGNVGLSFFKQKVTRLLPHDRPAVTHDIEFLCNYYARPGSRGQVVLHERFLHDLSCVMPQQYTEQVPRHGSRRRDK